MSRFVTFKDLVPGMVLYPVDDVNTPAEKMFGNHIVLERKVDGGQDKFWSGKRALYYIDMQDPHMGICSSAWRTDDSFLWEVVDDAEMLAKIRAYVKNAINDQRDHLDEVERLVDVNC